MWSKSTPRAKQRPCLRSLTIIATCMYSIVSFIYPNLPFLPHNLSGKYYFDFHWQMRKLRQREKQHALQILPRPTDNPQVRPGGHLQPWWTAVVMCHLLPESSYLHPRHARKLMCLVTMLKSWWAKTLASLVLGGNSELPSIVS